MSSNISIVKICEYCNHEFIAKKTTSKTCSDDCAKRFYKLKKREEKIRQAELKTEINRKPKAFITEDQIRVINAKQFLNLKEAAILLNITPLTLRRWVLAGKVSSKKLGKKHVFDRNNLFSLSLVKS